MDSLGDLFNAAIGGGISGSGVAILARLWFGSIIERNKQLSVQNNELAKALDELKTKDIAELKKDFVEHVKDNSFTIREDLDELKDTVKEHVENDQSQRIITLLESRETTLNKIEAKFDHQAQLTAARDIRIENQLGSIGAEIKAQGLYLGNLDKSFENHKNVFHSGRG